MLLLVISILYKLGHVKYQEWSWPSLLLFDIEESPDTSVPPREVLRSWLSHLCHPVVMRGGGISHILKVQISGNQISQKFFSFEMQVGDAENHGTSIISPTDNWRDFFFLAVYR